MAKKKWDENKVTRDESGRFVSQNWSPQAMPGLRNNHLMLQQRLQQMQQNPDPRLRDNHLRLQQQLQQPNNSFMQIETSSAKPKRRSRGKLA